MGPIAEDAARATNALLVEQQGAADRGILICRDRPLNWAHNSKFLAYAGSFIVSKPVATQPIRVLLVDDSPIALTILQRLLQATPDIEVVGAVRNGEEALQAIPLTNPQVICTDLHMPKHDGIWLLEKVKARLPGVPVILVSGYIDEPQLGRLRRLGFADVLAKPLPVSELANTVARVVGV